MNATELGNWQIMLGGSFYAYDLDGMLRHLRGLEAEGLRLWYACKANPLSAVLQTVNEAGLSFDVASLGELEQVLKQEVDAKNILLTGPAKTEKFLRRAFAAGVQTFVAESHGQLEQLEGLAREYSCRPRVLLRLQLSWNGEDNVLGGAKTSVFGLDPASWRELDYPALNISGVHVFQWGNIRDSARLGSIWTQIAKVAREFAREKKFPLEVLDLGGGLGVPYHREGFAFPWEEIRALLPDIRKLSGAQELWLELGRYAVGPFGTYVTRVQEAKTVKGEKFLVCEGGAQHMVRPALVGESFPVSALRDSGAAEIKTQVHGPLCTTLDRLGTYDLPGDLKAGDVLAFGQCGAYGFTESMPFFLCHDLPGEIVRRRDKWEVIRRVEPAQSWLR